MIESVALYSPERIVATTNWLKGLNTTVGVGVGVGGTGDGRGTGAAGVAETGVGVGGSEVGETTVRFGGAPGGASVESPSHSHTKAKSHTMAVNNPALGEGSLMKSYVDLQTFGSAQFAGYHILFGLEWLEVSDFPLSSYRFEWARFHQTSLAVEYRLARASDNV